MTCKVCGFAVNVHGVCMNCEEAKADPYNLDATDTVKESKDSLLDSKEPRSKPYTVVFTDLVICKVWAVSAKQAVFFAKYEHKNCGDVCRVFEGHVKEIET
jgi:hypothetical protein